MLSAAVGRDSWYFLGFSFLNGPRCSAPRNRKRSSLREQTRRGFARFAFLTDLSAATDGKGRGELLTYIYGNRHNQSGQTDVY